MGPSQKVTMDGALKDGRGESELRILQRAALG